MPFIKQERRDVIAKSGLVGLDEIQVGDRCYVFYKEMVDRWKDNPRWTTAHEIYKDILSAAMGFRIPIPVDGVSSFDDAPAKLLAWQIFFMKYVWPYEQKKIKENGDI